MLFRFFCSQFTNHPVKAAISVKIHACPHVCKEVLLKSWLHEAEQSSVKCTKFKNTQIFLTSSILTKLCQVQNIFHNNPGHIDTKNSFHELKGKLQYFWIQVQLPTPMSTKSIVEKCKKEKRKTSINYQKAVRDFLQWTSAYLGYRRTKKSTNTNQSVVKVSY